VHSPLDQIRWGLAYIRERYGPSSSREPRFYLYVDGGELQRVVTDAVAAAIEEHTRRQAAAFRDERRR